MNPKVKIIWSGNCIDIKVFMKGTTERQLYRIKLGNNRLPLKCSLNNGEGICTEGVSLFNVGTLL